MSLWALIREWWWMLRACERCGERRAEAMGWCYECWRTHFRKMDADQELAEAARQVRIERLKDHMRSEATA